VTWFNYAHGLSTAKCPFGGEPVPILPLVYRRVAIWGSSGGPSTYPDVVLDSLFWNVAGRILITRESDLADVTDLFYLLMVPWFKIQSLDIDSFHRDGDDVSILLSENSTLLLNKMKKTYSVNYRGIDIARNGTTFCPLDDERLALYALVSGVVTAPLPTGWDPTKLVAVALDTERHWEIPIESENGSVKVSIPARRPVIVYRHGDKGPKKLLYDKGRL